jgi:hypothetical protein
MFLFLVKSLLPAFLPMECVGCDDLAAACGVTGGSFGDSQVKRVKVGLSADNVPVSAVIECFLLEKVWLPIAVWHFF